jgi:predicted ArsR family transcriptional regulator
MTDYLRQPSVAVVLRILRNRRGATIRQIAKARNYTEHTVRSIMSRMRSRAGLDVYRAKKKNGRFIFRIGRRARHGTIA